MKQDNTSAAFVYVEILMYIDDEINRKTKLTNQQQLSHEHTQTKQRRTPERAMDPLSSVSSRQLPASSPLTAKKQN